MANSKYLYGASVQGIQDFIFQTNELKDVVGASELVEKICTDLFDEFVQNGINVVNAAGNVKCIYSEEQECRRAVRLFPKKVMEAAPGVKVSEAVVSLSEDESDFEQQIEELERRLRIQRNKHIRPLTVGTIAMLRSRTTGLPAVSVNSKNEFLDKGTEAKRANAKIGSKDNSTQELARKAFGNDNLDFRFLAYDIDDLTNGENDWIAVIHADGNGLGEIVARKNKSPKELQAFSKNLDQATKCAAQQTYADLIKSETFNSQKSRKIPIRPVVLGGDDMTVICRADVAMHYCEAYLRHFEENTYNMGDALTACAGIAYMKSSYPFYYGYRLAEKLCEQAKTDAKKPEHTREKEGLAPSCLIFHKIQGSFIKDFEQIERDELTIRNESLKFGPYYLHEIDDRWTIKKLREMAGRLNETNEAKSDIRQWLTLKYRNADFAKQFENRVKNIAQYDKALFNEATTADQRGAYPAYDLLQLLTVETQITKTRKQ